MSFGGAVFAGPIRSSWDPPVGNALRSVN